jgi:Leucine-rich repeat (LRR) protein
MTEKQIEHGFWLANKDGDFPPENITYPHDYKGTKRVSIACTQLHESTASVQKSLVKQWVQLLPTYQAIEMLWFSSLTPQAIFDSACKLKNLTGLNIKWSNIKSVDRITDLQSLKYLRIGSSAKIESISPLTSLTNLEVLVIENFNKITDFSALSALTNLKFLTIEGGMYTKQKVDSFEFVTKLQNLIYLSTAMINCADINIDPILKLKNLQTLNWPFDLSNNDMQRLTSELPNLKFLPHRYYENNMKKIKGLFG